MTTFSGESAANPNAKFTYVTVPAPTITALNPNSGSTAGGTTVLITGTNFTNATEVTFGGTSVFDFTVHSDTLITVLSPPHIAGIWDVTVTTPSGTSTPVPASRFTYTAAPAPALTALSPASGSAAGGTLVTVTGTNFTGAYEVLFGDESADFTVLSDTTLKAFAPPHAAGTVYFTVTTYTGTSATVSAAQFTYTAAPAPAVTAISPTTGTTAGGTSVTITGSNFTGASEVKFGGQAASSFQVVSASLIFATAPPQAAGTVHVRVTTPSGTSAEVAGDQFTYTAAPLPAVTAISPTSGSTAGGTVVTIVGSNFTGATSVKFGTLPATSFAVNSPTSITATSPLQGTGTVHVTVTTYSGMSAEVPADHFTYVYVPAPAPTVTAISPTTGTAAGGTVVGITGTNFASASSVTFGGVPAASFTILSNSYLEATSPAGSPGPVFITVTTPSGDSGTPPASEFTYVSASVPTVTGISPTTGTTAGGTSVTITGTSFTGATKVLFGSFEAGSFTLNSATQITANSPAQAASHFPVSMKRHHAGLSRRRGLQQRVEEDFDVGRVQGARLGRGHVGEVATEYRRQRGTGRTARVWRDRGDWPQQCRHVGEWVALAGNRGATGRTHGHRKTDTMCLLTSKEARIRAPPPRPGVFCPGVPTR